MNATIRGFKSGEPYRVIKPIPVSLRKANGQKGWIARFVKVNIGIQADTKREAIRDLRSIILDCYEDWSKKSPKKLSQYMQTCWQNLQQHVQRKS